MKNKIYLGLTILNFAGYSQQNPTNTSPAGVGPSGQANQQFWSRAGNNNSQGANNIFGTLWNSPVYHFTNNKNRMVVFDDTWSGLSNNTSTPFGGGVAINYDQTYPITRPWALLTIGQQSSVAFGYRTWMKIGTYNSLGSDNMYIGLKTELTSSGYDHNDAIINWGDNTTVGSPLNGPDYLRFIFTSPSDPSIYPAYASSNDGLEVMRMNWEGKVGIGNYYNNVIEAPFSKDPSRRFEILSDKTRCSFNST